MNITTMSDYHYPDILKSYKKAPQRIEYNGNKDLFNSSCIAIIGTREPSEFAQKTAYALARFFATEGYTIVSGLAYGIDTAAHLGALSVSNGKTIAILGKPLSDIYPRENIPLVHKIIEQNGLVYYAPGTNFVTRDYLQAEQSLAIIPVQAGLHSGTRHAVLHAMNHRKCLFVPIPNPQDREQFPEKYAGIESYISAGMKMEICTTFTGKQDYPKLLGILHSKLNSHF